MGAQGPTGEQVVGKVLVVDDDPIVLRAVSEVLRRDGHEVIAVQDPVEGLGYAREHPGLHVALVDLKMPHLSGLDLLGEVKRLRPQLEVVIMTGFATVETAVKAVKAGAYDYLTKPFERIDQLSAVVGRAVAHAALRHKAQTLEEALTVKVELEGLVGQSAAMRGVFKLIEAVGPSAATVLVRGESGTGKELVARAIHYRGPRRDRPFVAVNCSALTDTLLETELFGHVKGAFTGATANKKGLFEAAHTGTLFLDEIGDISTSTQVRLLRVLQEGEIKRVGANESVPVDVRVISATHVDLEDAKAKGRFREDLYYRLNVVRITLPGLRDRPEDIPLLAQHFLHRFSAQLGKEVTGFSREALEQLARHRWPGNVRELENAVERAVVLCSGPVLEAEDLPPEVLASPPQEPAGEAAASSLAHLPFAQAKSLAVSAFERRYLNTLLARCGQNISAAAIAAGMDRSNFRRLLKQHGLSGRREPDEAEA